MKHGWEVKKLGELSKKKNAVVSGPFGSNLKVSDYKTVGIPILRLQNIGKGYFVNKSIKYISEEKAEELKYHSFISGDIALAKLGIPIGKTCIIPSHFKSGIITADIVRIRPEKKIVDYNYLEYYLNTDLSVSQLTGNISGATRPRVNLSDVRNIEVPLPPLPEQQRIVAILDEAFDAIAQAKANAEQNLKNTQELFESYLQSVFETKGKGWEHISLGEICKINDGTHFSPKNTNEGEFMYITAKNIKPYYIDLTKITYISAKDHKEIYSRCSPVKGDVLYIKDGATAGIGAINIIDEEFSLLSSVALFKCSPKINNSFLVHYMNSKIGRKNFLGYIDGAAITRLTLIKLKNVCMSLPPIAEQQTIVTKLDALSEQTKKLESIYKQKLADLEELKKSILHKAFNGEL